MNTSRILFWSLAILTVGLAAGTPVWGEMIEGGTIELPAGLASVSVSIDVTPGDTAELIQGMLFSVIVGVGDGSDGAPKILGLDAENGTIFEGNNTGQLATLYSDWDWDVDITTSLVPDEIDADGTIVNIQFSTLGTTVGETFSLDLNAYSSSYFYSKSGDLIPTIESAQIAIVPEPAMIALLLAGATAVMLMTCWRKRCTR